LRRVGGTIYVLHTLSHLIHLGLDSQRAIELAHKLHAHSVLYAYKLTSTRRAIEFENHSQGQGWGWALLGTLLTPTSLFCPFCGEGDSRHFGPMCPFLLN